MVITIVTLITRSYLLLTIVRVGLLVVLTLLKCSDT